MKIIASLAMLILLSIGLLVGVLNLAPRPADTTEAKVFAGDGASVDYCELPLLTGNPLVAAGDIPKAYTPTSCRYEKFPMPILDECTEPLAPGAPDLRGLWLAYTGMEGHVERVEQCGNRVIVTSSGIIHDITADGTLANGANDVRPSCLRIFAAGEYNDNTFELYPLGLPFALVTRKMENDELVWKYPGVGIVRMKRICQMPAGV